MKADVTHQLGHQLGHRFGRFDGEGHVARAAKHTDLSVLFINCPFGDFFKDLCAFGDTHGVRFERMAFDGGDFFEAPKGRCHLFRGADDQWAPFCLDRLSQGQYDLLVVYNDALPFNRVAVDCARQLKIPYVTLENGYLRPHWVTLEAGGVNGNSSLVGVPIECREGNERSPLDDDVLFEHRMANHVAATMWHFTVAILTSGFFPYRPRYYGVAVLRQGIGYAFQYYRPMSRSEKMFTAQMRAEQNRGSGARFLCVLQKPGDTQLQVHSDISENNVFLGKVLESFAQSAPADAFLAVKRHPYDYGIERTGQFFHETTQRLGIADRCVLLEKMKMVEALDWSDALIVNNSSTGLEALRYNRPVIALGRALYNRPGLTFTGGLDAFWGDPGGVDQGMVEAFVSLLRTRSQVNGGFYSQEARRILFPRLLDRMREVIEDYAGREKPDHEDSSKAESRDASFGAPVPAGVPVLAGAGLGRRRA